MKLLNAILALVVLVLMCYSCGNKTDKNIIEKKSDESKIINTTSKVNADNENVNSERNEINNEECRLTTSYDIYDNYDVLNGKVKRMTEVRYPVKFINGMLVVDTIFKLSHHEIAFDKDGKEISNSYYIASGGGYASVVEKDSVGNVTLIFRHCGYKHDVVEFIINKYDEKSRIV